MDITELMDEHYYTKGRGEAYQFVKKINEGIKFSSDPLYYQENLAKSSINLRDLSIFLYEAPENPLHQLRKDYLSNQFIQALNLVCEELGLPVYVDTSEVDITSNRMITFDEPDYSDLDEWTRNYCLEFYRTQNELRKMREDDDKLYRELDEYYRTTFGDEYADAELEKMKARKRERELDPFSTCLLPDATYLWMGERSFLSKGIVV